MKYTARMLSLVISAVLITTMFSFAPAVFAGESEQEVTQTEPAFTISVIHSPGGTVSVSPETVTAEAAQEGVKVTVTPDKGYGVSSIKINGKAPDSSVSGPVSSGNSYIWTIYPKKDTTVKAVFRKSSGYVFIMLDAGHYGKVNRSPVLKSYYESQMTWKLQNYLKAELQEYTNVVVDTTRSSQAKDLGVYERGTASRGYDLFLSLHSNATSSKSTDYPLIITQKGNTKDPLAILLGQTIESVMDTRQGYQTWQRLNKDKKTEYYGVLRGSKAVGTKGMILEHSFHTNLAAAKWLSNNANLKEMAKAEAAAIAVYYGLSKEGTSTIPLKKPSVRISNTDYRSLTLSWNKSIGAQGYEVYRSKKKNGTYKRVKTIQGGSTLKFTNRKLTCGTTYYYKVRAYRKSKGTTRYSSFSAVKSRKVRPLKPSVSIRQSGNRKITVSWKKVAGTTRYVVYRAKKKKGKYKRLRTLKASARSFTNSGLKKGSRYYYKVRSYRKVKGKKVYSDYSRIVSRKAK